MAAIFKKVSDFLLGAGGDEYEDEYDEVDYYEDDYEEVAHTDIRNISPRKDRPRGSAGSIRSIGTSNVVDLHKRTRIDINTPRNIEDARDVIDNTRANIISIVNLEGVESSVAQRIADFLSGSVDALDGNIRRLSHDMFVITPNGVDISGDLASDIDDHLKSASVSLPWLSSAFS